MRRRQYGGEVAWDVSDLRTRFSPRSRFPHGLVEAAPWINIVLLIIFFLLFHASFVLQPGVVVRLPEAPFVQGRHYGPTAVVMYMGDSTNSPGREILFFDDKKYDVDDLKRMEAFKAALANSVRDNPDAALVVEADKRIKHGTVVGILNMARDVGVKQVNVATRPGSDQERGTTK